MILWAYFCQHRPTWSPDDVKVCVDIIDYVFEVGIARCLRYAACGRWGGTPRGQGPREVFKLARPLLRDRSLGSACKPLAPHCHVVIFNEVEQDTFDKYGIKPGDVILAEDKHQPLSRNSSRRKESSTLRAAPLNSPLVLRCECCRLRTPPLTGGALER